ncbi:hypothetical protein [Phenylobacterium aquaticum]|uniref:hypothetical protein n=1 Tax=Phenylobacterium aquaticum TaxID=1763816 RepID=UPI0026F14152|nr:hypothetical protein [Phenylobacterium aquaticum]
MRHHIILAMAGALIAMPALAQTPTDRTATHKTPADRTVVVAGGGSLWRGPHGDKVDPSLAEQLDGCLYPAAGSGGDSFRCVALTSRAAARAYRRIAGIHAWESEGFTAGATTGFLGLAASIGHGASNTVNAWTGLGLIPIISDDIASPGPRARLYTVAGTAMTLTTVRAEALRDALGVTSGMIAGPGQAPLQARVKAECSPGTLDAIDAIALVGATKAEKAVQSKARDKLSAQIRARCDELTLATQKLAAAAALWNFGGDAFARNLAADATTLDDTITRLDRQTLAPPRGALSVVLNAALNLPSKLVGGATPPEYVGRNLPVFTSTYTFNLARAPDADLPSAIGADLSLPAGLDTAGGQRPAILREFNSLTAEINGAIAAGIYFKTANDRSILSVSPGADTPVTLTSPTRP